MITNVGQLIEVLENVPPDTQIVFKELTDDDEWFLTPTDIVYETSLMEHGEKLVIHMSSDVENIENVEKHSENYYDYQRNDLNRENPFVYTFTGGTQP